MDAIKTTVTSFGMKKLFLLGRDGALRRPLIDIEAQTAQRAVPTT